MIRVILIIALLGQQYYTREAPRQQWDFTVPRDAPLMTDAVGGTSREQQVTITRIGDEIMLTSLEPTMQLDGRCGTELQKIVISVEGWKKLLPEIKKAAQ